MNLFTLKNGVLTPGILVTFEQPDAVIVSFLQQFPRVSLRELLGLREEELCYNRDGYAYPNLLSIRRDGPSESDVLVLVEKDVGNEIVDLFYGEQVPELLAQHVSFGYGFSTMSMLYRLSEGARFTVLKRQKKSAGFSVLIGRKKPTIFNLVATVTCVNGGLEVTEAPQPRGWFSWLGF